MHDRMLPEQNNFTGRTDKPFLIYLDGSLVSDGLMERKFLYGLVDCIWNANEVVGSNGYGPSFKKGVLQVVEEIGRVFYFNTKTDEILRKTTCSTGCWVNGSVSVESMSQQSTG